MVIVQDRMGFELIEFSTHCSSGLVDRGIHRLLERSLCYGVPYINVIVEWDWASPWDKSRWITQQDQSRQLGPPQVYHVVDSSEI